MLFDGFSPAEILALSKIAGTPANRKLVDPGTHLIDVVAQVRGELKVGEDHDTRQPNAIPWQRIATRLLGKVNASTRRKVIADSLQAEARDADDIKAEAQKVVDELLEETIVTRSGAVRGELIAVNVSGLVTLAERSIHKVEGGRRRSSKKSA